MPVVETRNLVKHYGRIAALKGLSLEVEKGEIYGLLGQNGAGKTTLVKILLGIARKWQGEAYLLDKVAGVADVRKRVGYLPEDHRFPEYHSASSLLDFYGQLLGVSRDDRRKRIPEMLEKVDLSDRMHTKIRTYSKGMKQRVGIAQALFHDPEVIFLDEPTDGVDPVGRREIREVMQRLRDEGKTIFLNSHLLGEVELICNRVGILHRGRMIREGDVSELTKLEGLYVLGIDDMQDMPADELKQQGYEVNKVGKLWEFRIAVGQSIDDVLAFLHERGLRLRHLVEKRLTLEDLFLASVDDGERRRRRPDDDRYERDDDRRRPGDGRITEPRR